MHILATSSASLDDLVEPVDLRQTPAPVVALSFSDSDLAALGAAWKQEAVDGLDMRLVALRDLRHPMSVDLWLDGVTAHAKVIVVRILGGYDWWRYGCDQLAAVARQRGIRLALLPGECREQDERLVECSTLPRGDLDALLGFFRQGGPDNMRGLARSLVALTHGGEITEQAHPVPKAGFYGCAKPDRDDGTPLVPILFYRSMLLAADVAPIDALTEALRERGIRPLPIFVASLKDEASCTFVRDSLADARPGAIVTATAFAASAEPGRPSLFDGFDAPVFQVVTATTRREAWAESPRGLAPADLAMHVVLPELDGRILAGPISFKAENEMDAVLGHRAAVNRTEQDRVESVADRIAAFLRLQRTPRADRRVAILIPDYPNAPGRSGYAVGLDVPQSVLAMLQDLKAAGYTIDSIPESPRALLDRLERAEAGLAVEDYRRLVLDVPAKAMAAVEGAWGPADTSFQFRAATFGNVTVALAPDRGRSADRRADYHDPALPPHHALVAFGLWMQNTLGLHAIVHVGAHGTLEWLPGKTVALSRDCFPEIVTGGLPVVYPFIVNNPGEAAQAKRRIGAVTLGHLPPPLVGAGLDEAQQTLERLVDEYAQADGLDRRRRDTLAKLIVETASGTGLAGEAGVAVTDAPDEALRRIDAWLCDLKDFAIKDGLHVYGRNDADETDARRIESANAERAALLAALDGRRVAPGPSGAPQRGRSDVFPTGRNLYATDPRALPTPTAFDIGRRAADDVLRRYLQDHGDWPRVLVIDLWGSASLRTGGEEIAQGLFLMGCRPQWDSATGRVTGVEVLSPAAVGRPRVDVTWRISGLFRDMFAAQIALLDAATRAVAAREGEGEDNPLAMAARRAGDMPARIFGSSPGTYGAGTEDLLARGDWTAREEIGQAYLDAASHAYGGADAAPIPSPGAFARRIAEADLLVHSGDDATRDILDGSADVAFVGGFSAALAAVGGKAEIVMLDTSDPQRPRARSVTEAVTRVVRARAVNRRFIQGQMRHGPRGASEFAETVDRLVAFAETTNAVPGRLIGAVHDAYVADEAVRAFILRENPAAARVIAERFLSARRRGLWHPLRNSVDDDLATLIAEASTPEAAE
jgi:cobaltochelatase CobN